MYLYLGASGLWIIAPNKTTLLLVLYSIISCYAMQSILCYAMLRYATLCYSCLWSPQQIPVRVNKCILSYLIFIFNYSKWNYYTISRSFLFFIGGVYFTAYVFCRLHRHHNRRRRRWRQTLWCGGYPSTIQFVDMTERSDIYALFACSPVTGITPRMTPISQFSPGLPPRTARTGQ